MMITKSKSKDISTLIFQVVWIQENLFLDMCLLSLTQQSIGSLSTTGAEYITLTEEALWLEGFAKELKLQGRVIIVKCDSQSTIHLSNNSTYHE